MGLKIVLKPLEPFKAFTDRLKVLEKAVVSTLNKTAAQAKTEASRLMREEMSVKSSEVSKQLTVIKARTIDDAAYVVATGKRIPFIAFPISTFTVSTSKGPRQGVKVDRFGTPETVEGGFLAIMGSGKKGVYARKASAASSSGERKNRLPIDEKFSTSLKSLFIRQDIQDKLIDFVDTKGPEIFDNEFKFYAEKILNSKL